MALRLRRAKGVVHISARVTNVGGKVRSGYLPFLTNASTLPITPRRSSSRAVGTSSYRYPTATTLYRKENGKFKGNSLPILPPSIVILSYELWFQQDGATCHTARATIDLLKDTFGDRLISRFGPVNWPPRSCDLTPLDYFLWGYVKSLVYADKPQTLDHLEDNIRRVIADIQPLMLQKVIENRTSRLDYIRASRGSHMPEIIFKM
ncbi:uncharacterized protein TNCV_2989661 [Trichonephila clavipes]|nr:uncharacterized protein TNCV_2989661 [Trichonephila clavipes]